MTDKPSALMRALRAPTPAERVRRTVRQVVVACVAVIAFVEAMSASGVPVPHGHVLVAVCGAVMVAVAAAQNHREVY